MKHNIKISVRHLKRKLRELDKEESYSDLYTVLSFLENQLTKSGQMHGCKWMNQKCLLNEYGGCPTFMRGDIDTENVRDAAMQRFLQRSDGLNSESDRTFIYGKSTRNTRTGSWCGILRKECCQI
ncbi:hypothetical protein CHS0354_027879 [Potamilus streckersoni]|uniref:Uncharacterized protein n=1 Tax=Potamilus streckersoni TaxID=2493646 RepID=A0AAE0T3K2_9BIVA|nr:hypothetical protein CHS0354_027879 [Potamilus streckersoni]